MEILRYVCWRPNPSVRNSENGFACFFSCSTLCDVDGACLARILDFDGSSGCSSSSPSTCKVAVARDPMRRRWEAPSPSPDMRRVCRDGRRTRQHRNSVNTIGKLLDVESGCAGGQNGK